MEGVDLVYLVVNQVDLFDLKYSVLVYSLWVLLLLWGPN